MTRLTRCEILSLNMNVKHAREKNKTDPYPREQTRPEKGEKKHFQGGKKQSYWNLIQILDDISTLTLSISYPYTLNPSQGQYCWATY